MRAEIISVGTELLLGQIVDTNAAYLASKLPDLGISAYYRMTVGDNPKRLAEVIRLALSRSDIVFTIGGLGPTQDDLTKETVAAVLGDEMVFDAASARAMSAYFDKIGVTMTENNLKQAMVPKRGKVLENPNGTAPGAVFVTDSKIAIVLPGPPREFIPMVDNKVLPYLREYVDCWGVIKSKVLRVTGIGESIVEDRIKHLLSSDNPTIAPYAKFSEVHLRVTASNINERDAIDAVEKTCADLREILGDYIYGEDDATLAEVVVRQLIEKKLTLSTAESCTGGLISAAITDVPGASETLLGSVVSYSNDVKMNLLGVPKDIIENCGAVSPQCAAAMAEGVRKLIGTDIAVSSTGIAGPGGGSHEKPVGLVYIGLACAGKTEVEKFDFPGNRDDVRKRTVMRALDIIRRVLKN